MALYDCLDDAVKKCVSLACQKGNCDMPLGSLSSSVAVIDCDLYKQAFNFSDAICDYILLMPHIRPNVAVVEMKGGRVGDIYAQAQISNGIRILDGILGPKDLRDVVAILLHGKGIDPRAYRLLKERVRLTFRGRTVPIFIGRCGTSLETILSRYS